MAEGSESRLLPLPLEGYAPSPHCQIGWLATSCRSLVWIEAFQHSDAAAWDVAHQNCDTKQAQALTTQVISLELQKANVADCWLQRPLMQSELVVQMPQSATSPLTPLARRLHAAQEQHG